MTDEFNHNTRIIVVIAMLALLLGLILGGVFSITKENKKSGFVNIGVSDSTYRYKVVEGPRLLSEIDYHTSCNEGKYKPRIYPFEDPNGNFMSPL